MADVKVFAMYLPQYHETKENSRFWGAGFTDWVSVKKAEPLFLGHQQPVVPQDCNYYDLSKTDTIRWQANIARKYGVDAWGIYHYWFNSEQQALTTPVELLLQNEDIEMPFFLAWDNASWKRTWSKLQGNDWAPTCDVEREKKDSEQEILIQYSLGMESDWEKHFKYLLPYFKDARYYKHNNKPLFLIYRYEKRIKNMEKYWNSMAKANGFDGIEIVYSYNPFKGIPSAASRFYYEPLFSGWGRYRDKIKRYWTRNMEQKHVQLFDYEDIWKRIIKNASKRNRKNAYYGAFVGYDDSPRRGNKGKVVVNASPMIFGKYMKELLLICKRQSKPFVFLTAWNEWGEGAHLEPDEMNGDKYLCELKKIKAEM